MAAEPKVRKCTVLLPHELQRHKSSTTLSLLERLCEFFFRLSPSAFEYRELNQEATITLHLILDIRTCLASQAFSRMTTIHVYIRSERSLFRITYPSGFDVRLKLGISEP